MTNSNWPRDLIVPIGAWVLRTACRQAAAWRLQYGDATPEMCVNFSSRQLGRRRLVETVAGILAESGLPGSMLCLELTERQVIAAEHAVRADLEALRALGVKLAIDDFGTGHNGMSYLRDIPIDMLKIDRSFVSGLGTDRTDTALTTSILSLRASLGLSVVANGVETAAQRDQLRDLGCRVAQGHLMARPGPPQQIDEILAAAAGLTD